MNRVCFSLILSLTLFCRSYSQSDSAKPWFCTIGMDYRYCFRTVRVVENLNSVYITQVNNERPTPFYFSGIGTTFGRFFKNKYCIESGVFLEKKRLEAIDIPSSAPGQNASYRYDFRFISIPILFGYQFKINLFRILPEIGVTFDYATLGQEYISGPQSSGYQLDADLEGYNSGSTLIVKCKCGVDLRKLPIRGFLNLIPFYERTLTTLSDGPIQSKFYIYGLAFSLSFPF